MSTAPAPFIPLSREAGHKEGQGGVRAAVLPPPRGAERLFVPPPNLPHSPPCRCTLPGDSLSRLRASWVYYQRRSSDGCVVWLTHFLPVSCLGLTHSICFLTSL